MLGLHTRARSLAWLERPADNREVSSSNLVGPTITSLPRFVLKTILSLAFLLSVSDNTSTNKGLGEPTIHQRYAEDTRNRPIRSDRP